MPACLSAGGAVLPAAGSCRHAAVTLARSGNADAASCLRPALPPGAGDISGTPARLQHAHVLGEGDHVTVTASASADAAPAPGDGMGYGGGAGLKLLLIAGQPIREPIVQHGARVLCGAGLHLCLLRVCPHLGCRLHVLEWHIICALDLHPVLTEAASCPTLPLRALAVLRSRPLCHEHAGRDCSCLCRLPGRPAAEPS